MTRYARASWRLDPVRSLALLMLPFLAAVMLALGGCATVSDPISVARGGLKVFNSNVAQALDRGRITADQGAKVLVESRKVRKAVDDADEALALCGGKVPCDSFEQIMARVQPMLLELERKLREEEAAKAKGAKP